MITFIIGVVLLVAFITWTLARAAARPTPKPPSLRFEENSASSPALGRLTVLQGGQTVTVAPTFTEPPTCVVNEPVKTYDVTCIAEPSARLGASERRQIERVLGRSLVPPELVAVASLDGLTPAHMLVVRRLARQQLVLCSIYLRAVTATFGLGPISGFIDDVLSGRR